MVLKVDRFCPSLFAYLYKYYQDTPSSELSAGLPVRMNYDIPRDFIREIGDCQININKMLRRFLQPVFEKVYPIVCQSESTFLQFIKRRCLKLPSDHTTVLFLTICAVVSEFNLFCFQRECFRYAGFAPRCLAEVLRSSDEMSVAFLEEDDPFAMGSIDGYKALQEYCRVILDDIKAKPDFMPPIFVEVGKKFMKMKIKPIDLTCEPTTSTSVLSPVEEETDEQESEELQSLVAAAPPKTPDNCHICKENNCSKHLEEFVFRFALAFN